MYIRICYYIMRDISNIIAGCIAYYNALYQACYSVEIWYCNIRIRCHVNIRMSLYCDDLHYTIYVDTYITPMALMWHRYKKGHFNVKVNTLILLAWLPMISIITNLDKIMGKKRNFEIFSKSKGFLPLETMFRYG